MVFARHADRNTPKPVATTTANSMLINARPGWRRDHSQSRSRAPTGLALIGRDSRKAPNSSATSKADAYRREGSLDRHFKQMVSRSCGTRRVDLARRHWFGGQDLRQRRGRAWTTEGRAGRQEVIKERPQTIHIARDPNATALRVRLFGRHIAGGTSDVLRALGVKLAGQAEIGYPRMVRAVNQHISRFDIQMQDAAGVGGADSFGHGSCITGRTARFERAVALVSDDNGVPSINSMEK